MSEFNGLLASQQNDSIGSPQLEVSAEADAVGVPVPSAKTITVKIPIGVEFVTAGSQTSHSANGATATVNWNLPVFGVYTSPRLSFHPKRIERITINLRPVGIGYYSLGSGPISAELTITDRPGSFQARSTTWGYLGMAGVEYPLSKSNKGMSILVEGGYRHLVFHDVSLTPKGGVTTGPGGGPAQLTTLASSLDYSGIRIRVGIAVGL